MARITIEDGLKKGYNKFMLVHLAAKRAVQLKKGKEPAVECNNREIVTALREIEAGRVMIRREGSPSEDYLQSEPQLPASTDEQIESETVAEAEEGAVLEPDAGLGDQEEPDILEEKGAEADTKDQEDNGPEEE
jgi:DNA-directed RNA polymerase subunit omega